jgi:hypothetical protein
MVGALAKGGESFGEDELFGRGRAETALGVEQDGGFVVEEGVGLLGGGDEAEFSAGERVEEAVYGVAGGGSIGDLVGAGGDAVGVFDEKFGAEAFGVEGDGAVDFAAADGEVSGVITTLGVAGGGETTVMQALQVLVSAELERGVGAVGAEGVVVPIGELGGAAEDEVGVSWQEFAVLGDKAKQAAVIIDLGEFVAGEFGVGEDEVADVEPLGGGGFDGVLGELAGGDLGANLGGEGANGERTTRAVDVGTVHDIDEGAEEEELDVVEPVASCGVGVGGSGMSRHSGIIAYVQSIWRKPAWSI